jgi:hypothetical protein
MKKSGQPIIILSVHSHEATFLRRIIILRKSTTLHSAFSINYFSRQFSHHGDQESWFDPRSGHVGIMVEKVEAGPLFSDCFGFRVKSHSTNCSTSINQPIIHAKESQY